MNLKCIKILNQQKEEAFSSQSLHCAQVFFLTPEATALSPTVGPQLIHLSCWSARSSFRPGRSSLKPQGTGISVWSTQQEHRDPRTARQAELVRPITLLEVSIKWELNELITGWLTLVYNC